MIVPYEIAVKLKQLGFSKPTLYYYESNGEIEQSFFIDNECKVTVDDLLFDFNNDNWWGYPSDSISALTVSEALQDIRERYNIACGVYPNITANIEDLPNGKTRFDLLFEGYSYIYFDNNNPTGEHINVVDFPSHPEAELFLLKQVVEYLIEKR